MVRGIISALFVVFGLCVSVSSSAALVTGTSVWSGDFAESAVSTNLKYADSTPYSDLSVFMICVDVTRSYPEGNVSYTTEAGGSALMGGSGAAGVAAINWLFDKYYATYFKNGSDAQKWAFQYAVWELGNDYNGSINSISVNSGLARPTDDTYDDSTAGFVKSDFITAYQEIYQAMVSALPMLGSTYKSKKYTIDLFNSVDAKYQSMVALIEKAPPPVVVEPKPVPGLDIFGLLALTGLLSVLTARGLSRKST